MPASEVDSPPKDTRDLVFKFLENKLRIENRRGRTEFQYCKENIYTEKGEFSFEELRAARIRDQRLGKPNNSSDKRRPIIARFWRYSDKEMVMDQARKELKSQEDKQFSVFDSIPK